MSVRNAEEAETAIAGGADVIDVKEPVRGPLGAADPSVIGDVVTRVSGRVPVTAAAGELREFLSNATRSAGDSWRVPPGLMSVKLGLAGLANDSEWPLQWRRTLDEISPGTIAVAVVYADWRAAGAPHPDEVLAAAVDFAAPVILIDTCHKNGRSLFDNWPICEVKRFVERARTEGRMTVLAGSLHGISLHQAAGLGPDLVAVRGAACDRGRGGTVTFDRVRAAASGIGTIFAEGPTDAVA